MGLGRDCALYAFIEAQSRLIDLFPALIDPSLIGTVTSS